MQAHFLHLHSKGFQMVRGKFPSNEFQLLQLPSKDSGLHQDSNSQSGSSLGSVGVHFFTISYTSGSMKCDFWAHSWPVPWQALALVASPRLGLQQFESYANQKNKIVVSHSHLHFP